MHFLSHVIPETGNLTLVKEIDGEFRPYSPYYGRGLIQLTHLENYQSYGGFRKFPARNAPAVFQALGWDPNDLIAKDNVGNHDYINCVDSACFYVVRRNEMLRHIDAGVTQRHAITASKDVNGYVAIEYLNGLDVRLQSVLYLRNIFMDDIFSRNPMSISFEWRRNSQQEPVLDAHGRPVETGNPPRIKKKFYRTTHTINVTFDRQKP